MYSKALNNSLLTILAPQTHTRTHPKESDQKRSLLRPPARMERRAADQNLPRTCPPRVVFELIRTGHQQETSRIQTPASRDQPPELRRILLRPRTRAGEDEADPSQSAESIQPKNHQPPSVLAEQPPTKNQEQEPRRAKKNQEQEPRRANKNQEQEPRRAHFCLSVPFLSLSGAARFRHDSFAVGVGCRIPFLGVPKRADSCPY